MRTSLIACLFVLTAGFGLPAAAQSVFFSESFDNDAASFFNSGSDAIVDFVPTGGADGGGFVQADFAIGGFSSPFGGGPVLFRAQDEFMSSDNAFVDNYLAAGVEQISFSVRHDVVDNGTPVPLNFFVRIATPANFPGFIATSSTPVLPSSDFTEVTFDLPNPFNPEFTFEGPPNVPVLPQFQAIFSNVGALQFGASLADGFTGSAGFGDPSNSFTFALDEIVVTAVPEPSTVLLSMAAVGVGVAARRRRDGGVRHG